MSKKISISAEPRERAGKGTARQTRRAGRIPAVIYGGKEPTVMMSLEAMSFSRILHQPGFFTHLFDVAVGDASHLALARDVQFDPVSDQPIHVDFLRVTSETRITVMIPVEFVEHEKSPGLKRGGVLNIVAHEIEVECAAAAIPENIVVSLDGVDIAQSIHIHMVKLPEGVKLANASDFTVASIAAPSALQAADEAADEAAAAAAAAASAEGTAPAADGAAAS